MTKMIDFIAGKLTPLTEDIFSLDGDMGPIKVSASPVQQHEVKKMIARGKGLRILVGSGKFRDMLVVWVGDSESNVGAIHETVAEQFGMSMIDRHVPLELTVSGQMRLTTTAVGIFDTPREVEDVLDRNKEYRAIFGSYHVNYRNLHESDVFQP